MRFKALACFLLALSIVGFSFVAVAAQNRSRRVKKKAVKVIRVVDDRSMIERQLLVGENRHDGSIALSYTGTIESVPALLKVLQDEPPRMVGPDRRLIPYTNDKSEERPKLIFICTAAHALAALRRITGQNFQMYEEWAPWWEKYKADQLGKQKAAINPH